MPNELLCLIAANGLYWLLGQLTATGKTQAAGTARNMGNRDTEPEVAPWVKRAERAQKNLLESLPLFSALLISVVLLHKESSQSCWGATIFVLARVAHAAVYTLGIPVVRSLAYVVSLVGIGMLVSTLFAG